MESVLANNIPDIPLADYSRLAETDMLEEAQKFERKLSTRRTVRDFSTEPVARSIIESAIRAAGSAPSGANKQPWTYVAIRDPQLKAAIREAAEKEEREFYAGRASAEWLADLAPLGTDWRKPFLDDAPWLIVLFQQSYAIDAQTGQRKKHYYVPESVGISAGFLIAALHFAGLATLTHTPSPMSFLGKLLKRPLNERPVMIIVAGYPADNARVPDIKRKPLTEISSFL